MKKKEIYEFAIKLFGFYLLSKSVMILVGDISFLMMGNHIHNKAGVNSQWILFFVYLFGGLFLLLRTGYLLKLFRMNDSVQIEISANKYTYHVAILILGGLLIVNNISSIAESRYVKESLGEYQNTIYKPTEKTDFHPEVVKLDIPKSYTISESKTNNIGSIVGVILGFLTMVFSKQLSSVFTPSELKEV